MKTLQKVKDQVARQRGFKDWNHVREHDRRGLFDPEVLEDINDQVSETYITENTPPLLVSGIELIAKERQEQIEKHGYTLDHDIGNSRDGQLSTAASRLLQVDNGFYPQAPTGWSKDIWARLIAKSKVERRIIAGALLAAEIDVLNHLKNESDN